MIGYASSSSLRAAIQQLIHPLQVWMPIPSSSRHWILDSGASFHVTGIQNKFDSLHLSNKFPSINIDDDTQSHVLRNKVVHPTPSLTLTNILYVPKFSVSLFSISQLTKQNNYKVTFFPFHYVFKT